MRGATVLCLPLQLQCCVAEAAVDGKWDKRGVRARSLEHMNLGGHFGEKDRSKV